MKFKVAITGFIFSILTGCGNSHYIESQSQPQTSDVVDSSFSYIYNGSVNGNNIHILKDSATGCEYIATRDSGITPRLDEYGKPRCNLKH